MAADIFSPVDRSKVMSRIRGSRNKATELRLIEFFRKNRITGWRRNYKLFGKPDFVFVKQRVIVFVDGCFWHGCPKHYHVPTSNAIFWEAKIAQNVARDKKVSKMLRGMGWRIMRVWQHELGRKNEKRLLARLRKMLPPNRL